MKTIKISIATKGLKFEVDYIAKILILITTFLIHGLKLQAQGWTQKQNCPISENGVGFSIGSKGYVGTGRTIGITKELWEYDPDNDTWTQKADFPGVAREYATGFSMDGFGYIGTGMGAGSVKLKDFWRYDPSSNYWIQIADFAGTARFDAIGLNIGTKGYVGLGNDGTNKNDFWEYDPLNDIWTQKTNYPISGSNGTAFGIGNDGFVFIGLQGYRFNGCCNSWSNIGQPASSQGFVGAPSFVIGSKGYVSENSSLGKLWEYNSVNNSWILKSSCSSQYFSNALGFSINGKGYMGTGYAAGFWEYDPVNIVTGFTTHPTFCQGEVINVPFTVSGTFNSGNEFTAELSDSSGTWIFGGLAISDPLLSTTGGTITATIPTNAPPSSYYSIRIVSTNPYVIGSPYSCFTQNYSFNVQTCTSNLTITASYPSTGPIGTEVIIEGISLSGATSVKFNGVSTSEFSFHTTGGVTYIIAIVPVGATTGPISVTTPNGTATSAFNFSVPSGPLSLVVNTVTNVSGGNYDNVSVANGGVATFTGGISVSGDIIVMAGGTAYFQDVTLLGQAIVRAGGYASLKQSCHVMNGSGSFELKDGATLEICHPDGISTLANTGNIQVTGSKTFSPKANYVYNGDVAQVTGNALPNTVNDLTINNLAGVTLSQNTTVNGVVYIKTGSDFITGGKLILASGASMMHGAGTPGGNEGSISTDNVTVKRDGHTSPSKWNFWGTPVTGADVSILGSRPNYYNPLNATDPNTVAGLQAGWVPCSGVMTQGVGYISKGGGTVSFTGTVSSLNNGPTISVPVVKNTNGVAYNVVGNPFPSAISAVEFLETNGPSGAPYFGNNTIAGSLYFWDDDGTNGSGYSQSDFAVWSGAGGVGPNSSTTFNGNIASGQGFSVEKLSTNNTPPNNAVLFTNSMRTTSNNVFFRQAPIERLWVSITSPVGLYNEVLVAFIDDATDGYDVAYDAKKFRGNDNIALYTKLNGADYAIQALAPLDTDKTVTLGFDAGIDGNYILNLKSIENLDESVVVLLEDTETGEFQNLRLNGSHPFQATAGKHDNRFILHFNPAIRIETNDATCMGNDATLTLQQNGSKHWNYALFDDSGNAIQTATGFNGTATLSGVAPGNYTLHLTDDDGYLVVKNIELKGKALVHADFESSTSILNVHNEISFINQSYGASRYEWNFGDGSPAVADENPVYRYSLPGIYEVVLTALNDDCASQKSSSVEVLELMTGISSNHDNDIFRAYVHDKSIDMIFNFSREQAAQLTIYDMLGKIIYSGQVKTAGTKTIDASHLAGGCVLIRLCTANEIFTQKIFISN